MMTGKFWLEAQNTPGLGIYLRIYRVNPLVNPSSGSISAIKYRELATRHLAPAYVDYNVYFNKCTIEEMEEVIRWQQVAKALAVQLNERLASVEQLAPDTIEELTARFVAEARQAEWGIVE